MSTKTLIATAARTFWETDTAPDGHLRRGQTFTAARDALIESKQAKNKTEAQKIIADATAASAPAHSKKFGASTVAQYVASYAVFAEAEHLNTRSGAENLYASVHRAYASSMGVDNIKGALESSKSVSDAVKAINALTRDTSAPTKDGERNTGPITLKAALAALARIQENQEWTEDERAQLFEVTMATAVAVQPKGDDED